MFEFVFYGNRVKYFYIDDNGDEQYGHATITSFEKRLPTYDYNADSDMDYTGYAELCFSGGSELNDDMYNRLGDELADAVRG